MGTSHAQTVRDWITRFIADSSTNSLHDASATRAWDAPLVGFARGDDPLFAFLHEDIGAFYWTPEQAFRAAYPNQPTPAHELSVICWVLPQSQLAKSENARATDGPSEPWARSRYFGEMCNDDLRRHVVAQFTQIGIPAVAPMLAPGWAWHTSAKYGDASNWSERHAAYIAGLGTFGLSDGLITAAGKAHRCGSVVARIALEPTPCPYKGIHDYCLQFQGKPCNACARRCPVGAITPAGHDKVRCRAFTAGQAAAISRDQYGIPTTPCGLCQTGVPCESCIP